MEHDFVSLSEVGEPRRKPCEECQSQGDAILTALVNLTTAIDGMHTTLTQVVDSLNSVGLQNTWIAENANRVFTAFDQMREQFAKGGLMNMMRGMNGG